MALLVVVFAIELLCYVVLTIGSKPINDLLWQLYCRTPFGTSRDFQDQIRLRRDVVSLKREMAGISAQDDFARWAKLRRKHDKALEEHDKKGTGPTLACFACHTDMPQPPPSLPLDPRSTPKLLLFAGPVQEACNLVSNSGTQRHPFSPILEAGSLGRLNGYWGFHAVHMEE